MVMTDRVGLEMLHYVGADRVMFAVDYPHNEGTRKCLTTSGASDTSAWTRCTSIRARSLPGRTRTPERSAARIPSM
jgi:hypothetical protein